MPRPSKVRLSATYQLNVGSLLAAVNDAGAVSPRSRKLLTLALLDAARGEDLFVHEAPDLSRGRMLTADRSGRDYPDLLIEAAQGLLDAAALLKAGTHDLRACAHCQSYFLGRSLEKYCGGYECNRPAPTRDRAARTASEKANRKQREIYRNRLARTAAKQKVRSRTK